MGIFFDGTGDFLSAGDVTFLDGAGPWSWSIPVKLDNITADQVIFEKSGGPSFVNTYVFIFDKAGPGGNDAWGVFFDGGSGNFRISDSNTALDAVGNWTYLSGGFENATNGLQLFKNGAETADSPTTNTSDMVNTVSDLLVGKHEAGGDERFLFGTVGPLTFWDVKLNDGEHRALGAGFHPKLIRPSSIIRHYSFLDTNHVFDEMGSGDDFTVTNAVKGEHPPLIWPSNSNVVQFPTPAVGGATPKGPFGHPFHGPFGGPI